MDINNDIELYNYLNGVEAWLAYNVTKSNIFKYTNTAIAAGVKRVVFTIESDQNHMNQTQIPEFNTAIQRFQENGGAFTGICHGRIIPGSEDHPYNIKKIIPDSEAGSYTGNIINSTSICSSIRDCSSDSSRGSGSKGSSSSSTDDSCSYSGSNNNNYNNIQHGVLARISTELLRSSETYHQLCAVSTGDAYDNAYLNILRSAGLTRQQEIIKIFQGGIYKVKELTNKAYEIKKTLKEERILHEKIRKQKVFSMNI